jgi:hypothetical protein
MRTPALKNRFLVTVPLSQTTEELMKLKPIAIAASLLGACMQANAVAAFEFSFSGTLVHSLDAWECPNTICPGFPGPPPPVISSWSGNITVVTSSGADGSYTGEDALAISQDSDLALHTEIRFTSLGPTATISNGALTLTGGGSAFVDYFPAPVEYVFYGDHFTYEQPAIHHYGPTTGYATLTPIPEPGIPALMLVGLTAVGVVAGKKRRADLVPA